MKKQPTDAPEAPEPRPLSPEWRQTVDSFLEFRRVHRGVSDSTLDHYRAFLPKFAGHVSPAGPGEIEARHIDSFLLRAHSLGREWARRASSCLRVFLRYLAMLGHVPAGLASQVSRPRTYRLAKLPRALEESDLRRVLRSVRRRNASGRREYAILMVLATYGLRVSDVAALCLDDIRWREGSIVILVEKTGRPLALPLTDPVGDALAGYLQHARPRSDRREVFLSLQRPFVPLSAGRVSQLVGLAMDRAGVKLQQVASHAFRHGFATRLVRNGVALDTVADCLGHASSATTFIYTKLAVEDLRSVALDPREVIP
ncbi:MAG: tyrosine-type recombinase/integrase [Myxococcaceae bacterium]|nr:tyrosine-type recombinase/integrase [Myxococcaceae bacterium]